MSLARGANINVLREIEKIYEKKEITRVIKLKNNALMRHELANQRAAFSRAK